MDDPNNLINDPRFVPFITHGGALLTTNKGTQTDRYLIVSSTLRVRLEAHVFDGAAFGKSRTWLYPPGEKVC